MCEIRERQSGREPNAVETARLTPAYLSFRPRVSVCIPVHNHAHEIVEALESVVGAEGPLLEILVLDDCSTDRTLDTVVEWMQARKHVLGRVMTRPVNRGLGPGRNDLLRTARGEYAFMLDADNAIYPAAIARLCEALDVDPMIWGPARVDGVSQFPLYRDLGAGIYQATFTGTRSRNGDRRTPAIRAIRPMSGRLTS